MTHTQRHSDEEICVRCGLSKSEWPSRRWQDPLCRVGETTYEQHTTTTDKRSRMSVLGDNENVYIRLCAYSLAKEISRHSDKDDVELPKRADSVLFYVKNNE